MSRLIDLTNRKFGRLTVIERAKNESHETMWLCECECGNKIVTLGSSLKRGRTKSCGCLRKDVATNTVTKANTKHGKRNTRLYVIWRDIKQRCMDTNSINYHNYGGRGIKICSEWANDFETFYNWSMQQNYKDGLTIDRIDVNGNYEPNNCRWITHKEQCNNTRKNVLLTYNEKTQTISQWAEELHINYHTLWKRIKKYHWTIEKALSTP